MVEGQEDVHTRSVSVIIDLEAGNAARDVVATAVAGKAMMENSPDNGDDRENDSQ